MLFSQLTTRRRRQPVALLALALTALTGCGREQTNVYQVPKEPATTSAAPAAAEAANPHQSNPHGMTAKMPKPTFTVPAGWEERPAGAMRVASYTISGPDEQFADIAVIPMPSVTGREADMVNMWRGQLKLDTATPDVLTASAEALEASGATGKLWDFVSTEKVVDGKAKGRILGAIVTQSDTAWFFKMAGTDAFVEAQKPQFREFVKSTVFPSAATMAAAASTPAAPGGGMMPPMGGGMMAGAGEAPAKPQWTVPTGWTEEPATQMLIAKYRAPSNDKKAEVTVSAFPGDVGGLLANVNRWRGQLQLTPLGPDDLTKAVTQLGASPGQMTLVELTGTDPKTGQPASLTGIIVPQSGKTWFYKLMGDAAVVTAQKDALIKFAQSVKYPDAP